MNYDPMMPPPEAFIDHQENMDMNMNQDLIYPYMLSSNSVMDNDQEYLNMEDDRVFDGANSARPQLYRGL